MKIRHTIGMTSTINTIISTAVIFSMIMLSGYVIFNVDSTHEENKLLDNPFSVYYKIYDK